MAQYVYSEGSYTFEFDDGGSRQISAETYYSFVEKCRECIKEDREWRNTTRQELVGSKRS